MSLGGGDGGYRNSPAADRDLLLVALMCGMLTLVAGLLAALMIGLSMSAAMVGGPAELVPLDRWFPTAMAVLGRPDDPGAALPAPWSALAGHPVAYWVTTGVLVLVLAAVLVTAGLLAWRAWGPTGPGYATRAQVRTELSLAAAREIASRTRPGMTPAQRRRAPLTEVGAPLHRGPIGLMCSPLENPTGTLAPTQSGKSRRDLVHKTIGAPGALLCSTTKPDLLEFAGLARTRREQAGPVVVFDATGAVDWPARVAWDPTTGCTDLNHAYRRAHTMVEAAAVGLNGVSAGNDKVFRERATFVLAVYLLAAATHRMSIASVVEWAVSKPPSRDPVELLTDSHPQLAFNLAAEMDMVAETSDAVWLSVRRVVEPLLDPNLLALCTPQPGLEFNARTHIGNQGSLFLVAGQHHALQVAPLLTALAEDWLTAAQDMALHYPTRRLDPPATAVLDELPNATPIPQLPDIISDSAGRGVIIHWAAQSMAQLEDTFSPQRARQLVDNTTTMCLWGGLKDARTLEWASTLSGHHDRLRHQHHHDGLLSPGRSSTGLETVPTLRPGDIRTIPRGQVLVYHRTLRPIRARTIDVSGRPDWKQLRADIDAVRGSDVPVDSAGYAVGSNRLPRWTVPASA